VVLFGFGGKELHQRHRNARQDLLQRADRRADAVLLDHRDGAVGDTGTLGQLTLGQALEHTDRMQALADVHWATPPGLKFSGMMAAVFSIFNMGDSLPTQVVDWRWPGTHAGHEL